MLLSEKELISGSTYYFNPTLYESLNDMNELINKCAVYNKEYEVSYYPENSPIPQFFLVTIK